MDMYRKAHSDGMGVSYLVRAVREKFVIEYKRDSGNQKVGEKDIFFYALTDEGGYHLLKYCKIPFLEKPGGLAVDEISRIITANHFMAKNGYKPDMRFPIDVQRHIKFFYAIKFIDKKNENFICYFKTETPPEGIPKIGTLKKVTTQEGIKQYFANKLRDEKPEKQEIISKFLETLNM